MFKLRYRLESLRLVQALGVGSSLPNPWLQRLSTAVVRLTWWVHSSQVTLLLLRSSKKGSNTKMEKSAIDNTSKENSSAKVDSLNAMNSYSVRPRRSLQPRSFRNHPCREVGPSRSWWVKLRFIDQWNMPTLLSSCIFSKIVTTSISCLSSAITRVWTSYSKGGRDFMSSRWSAIPCRSLMLSSICILIGLFIEI